MSYPIPTTWATNTNYNKFKASYANGDVDISQNLIVRNGDIYLGADRNIYSLGNWISFNSQYGYVNINNNLHVVGTQQLDYSGTTYNVGYSLVDNITRLTNISYTSGTNTTTITGNLTIPAGAITGYVPNTGASTIGGIKTFSNDIRLDGSLLLNAGALTLSNANLQKIQYLSNVTTDVSGSITTLQTNINNINTSAILSLSNTFSGTTNTFSNNIRADGSLLLNGGALTLSNANLQKIQYLSNVTTDVSGSLTTLQTNINGCAKTGTTNTFSQIQTFSLPPVLSGASISSNSIPSGSINNTSFVDVTSVSQTIGPNVTKIWQSAQTFSNNIRLDGSLIVNLGSTAITNATLRYLTNITSDVQTQFGACAKLAANTFTGIQTFSNNIIANSLTITPTVLGYLSGVTSNIQTQINSISTANFVSLTLDQTIAGLKTFSSLLTASAGFASTAITASTSLQVNSTSSTGSIFAVNQANTTQGYLYSGSLSGGGATDYSEGLVLRCGNYGLEIQGGLKQSVGDAFNIGFNNGGTFINVLNCVNTGTPSTNIVSLTGQLNLNGINILNYIQPVGTILTSVNQSVGAPFLACDGTAYSRTTYSALFAVIGIIYGIGDGSTTFNLPNFRGCFLRGNGSQTYNSVSYSAASVGTPQADALQDHTHAAQSGTYTGTTTVAGTNGLNPASTIKNNTFSFATSGTVNSGRTATETRPFNSAVYYYIRY